MSVLKSLMIVTLMLHVLTTMAALTVAVTAATLGTASHVKVSLCMMHDLASIDKLPEKLLQTHVMANQYPFFN